MSDKDSRDPDKKGQHPAKDAPNEHGEMPRTRDDSKDHKKDPFKDS